ncbi:MAG: type II toxin-antitoxin system VapC family toxin [Actinomycetia bacterium]|nr:type II toxin-antitoxin system VapC family toxin [Actinomycetes bacterium]
MKLFDVNVLVNAYREDAVHHEPCRFEIESAISSPGAFALTPVALSGFLRVVTHRRVFRTPTPLVDAIEFVEILRSVAQVVIVQPGRRHWDIFTQLCLESRATGNLVPDAYLASIAIESGCEFVTTDRDFARFPGLTWSDPLSS